MIVEENAVPRRCFFFYRAKTRRNGPALTPCFDNRVYLTFRRARFTQQPFFTLADLDNRGCRPTRNQNLIATTFRSRQTGRRYTRNATPSPRCDRIHRKPRGDVIPRLKTKSGKSLRSPVTRAFVILIAEFLKHFISTDFSCQVGRRGTDRRDGSLSLMA